MRNIINRRVDEAFVWGAAGVLVLGADLQRGSATWP
jgi:hypothetical protein